MIQGTGSFVGVSLPCAGPYRLLRDEGHRVAPMRARTTALNSCHTAAREAIGRAQGAQPEAAGVVVGICGGFQMEDRRVEDPARRETDLGGVDGLGLLDVGTTLASAKVTRRVRGEGLAATPFAGIGPARGFEIHRGATARGPGAIPLFRLRREDGGPGEVWDGALGPGGRTWRTDVHGLFDKGATRRAFANWVRAAKGLPPLEGPPGPAAASLCDVLYRRLAEPVRRHLDLSALGSLLGLPLRKEVVPPGA